MKSTNLVLPENIHQKITKFAQKNNKTFKQVLLETVAARSDIFTKKDIKEILSLSIPKQKGRGDVAKKLVKKKAA